MGRRRLLALFTVASLILAGALVLALGGRGTDGITGAELADAADATIRAGGARFEAQTTMTVAGTPERIKLPSTGIADMNGEHMHVRLDMSELAKAAGDGDDHGDWHAEMIYDYPVFYMRFPPISDDLPDGKSWVRLDIAGTLESLGVDRSVLDADNANPAQQLQFLRAAGGEVEKLGSENIRGLETTHYRGQIDLRRYPRLVPPEKRKRAEESVKNLIDLTGDPVDPVDVWVDDNGLVRRLTTSYQQDVEGQAVKVEQTIDYVEFGVGVRIDKPPAHEVHDLTDEAAESLKEG